MKFHYSIHFSSNVDEKIRDVNYVENALKSYMNKNCNNEKTVNQGKRNNSGKKKSKKRYGKAKIMSNSDSTHHKYEKKKFKHFHDKESSKYCKSVSKYFGVSIL